MKKESVKSPGLTPISILEIIQRSADFLARKGVESPRLQIELILAQVLGISRMQLYLSFEKTLSADQLETARAMVQRRGQREPLQYILGGVSFCGLELKVSRAALIPRPETELLAERAWTFLKTLPQPGRALDFGAGTGALAIAMAVRAPGTAVSAVDASPEALALARENAARHKASIAFFEGDGFAALPPEARFDLIVSNPPYIASAEIQTLEPELREHEPRMALDGGADGLDFYRRFAEQAGARLSPGGRLLLEFGDGQGPQIQALFERQNWVVEGLEADYTGRLRILAARRRPD